METEEQEYREALDYLSEHYTAFHKVGAKAYHPGLESTLELSARLGNPHTKFNTIHVGGTNGKGSTAHSIAAILQCAGLKVGLYTSPHILDFRERIRVNGRMIDKAAVVDFMKRLRDIQGELAPSFFEVATLMAFHYFATEKVDVAVIEVGLGGRLDSTNIITPILSVITNISLDHTALLGDTEAAIATEKAGIIKPGIPVVIGSASGDVLEVFRYKAAQCHSPLYLASGQKIYAEAAQFSDHIEYTGTPWGTITGELAGDCQRENAATIMTALQVLSQAGLPISAAAVRKGMAEVCHLTGLMGRWMQIQSAPVRVLCDTGHNIGGWRHLGPRLCAISEELPLRIILGFVSDKDIDAIFETMPRNAVYYFTRPAIDRARPAESTAAVAAAHGLAGKVYAGVTEAYKAALADASEGDTLFVGGSTFIVADLLASYNS